MQLPPPTNQYSLVLRLLIENRSTGVTMVTAMRDKFHKYQTRQLEIEKAHPTLKIRRLPVTEKNRFGHKSTFLNYKALSPLPYLVNLYNKLNREGLKTETK